MSSTKKNIRELTLDEIKNHLTSFGEKPFRAKQIFEWLWKKNAHTFSEMSNLSLPLRENLEDTF